MSEGLCILLIGHGSRLPYNEEMVDKHAGILRCKGYKTYTAYNEMTDPPIEDAMKSIVRDGFNEVVALPLFISSGKHTAQEIPVKLGIPEGYGNHVSEKYGCRVRIHYNEPFGDDAGVTDVLLQKLKRAGCADNAGVLLIAHGSPMSHNSDLVNMTADRLKGSGVRNVFVGFNEYNKPSIMDSYTEMINAGFEKIIVLPMFLASGVHIGEEIPEKLGIRKGSSGGTVSRGGRSIEIFYAETLGLNPDMNDILVKKIKASVVS